MSKIIFIQIVIITTVWNNVKGGCPSGYVVDSSGSICYMFVQNNAMTAYAAQDFCLSQVPPANLPIFYTATEENNFINLAPSYFAGDHWLGLIRACGSTAPTSRSSFRFIDGNVPTYSNWGVSEPNNLISNGLQESCVSMTSSHYWCDINCENNFQFACQHRPSSAGLKLSPMTHVTCYQSSLGPCPSGYIDDGSGLRCYSFLDSNLTAINAEKSCEAQTPTANIPTFQSSYEINFYISLVKNLNKVESQWLGLTRPCGTTINSTWFKWIDNTAVVDSYWGNGKPNNVVPTGYYTEPTCAIMDGLNNLMWSDTSCDTTQYSVCQIRMNQNIVAASVTYSGFQYCSAGCPSGYIADASGSICYKFVENNLMTAYAAQDFCLAEVPPASLPVFHTATEEKNYGNLATSLSFTNNDHWLGVTRACASSAPTSASSFRFLDGNVPTYSSWGATEPNNNVVNGIQESCVSSFITSSQWYDISCENSFQFACQYRPSTGGLKLSPITHSTCYANSLGPCPSGFIDDGSGLRCYRFLDSNLMAIDAQRNCEAQIPSANLPTFRSSSEINFYISLTQSLHKAESRWLGLTRPCGTTMNATWFQWIDNTTVVESYWDSGKPNNVVPTGYYTQPTCAIMDGSNTLMWSDTSCDTTQYTVCQIRMNRNTVETSVTYSGFQYCYAGPCPDTFVDDGSHKVCYLFFDNNITAVDAQMNCAAQTPFANLPTFRNAIEINAYITLAKNLNKTDSRWLGLTRPCGSITNASAFYWIDSTPVTDSNWGTSEPDNVIPTGLYTQSICTYLDKFNSLTWNDIPCDATQFTVCQYRINETLSNPISFPMCYSDSVMQLFGATGVDIAFPDSASIASSVDNVLPYLTMQLTEPEKIALGYQLNETILTCYYDGKPCDMIRDFVTVYDPDVGNCFTFNYPENTIYSVTREGEIHGLRMLLYNSPSEYTCNTLTEGYKVYIHDPTVYPFMKNLGLNVPVGYTTSITLFKKEYSSLSAPYGNCETNNSDYLYPGTFTTDGCYRSCYATQISKKCDCGDPRYPLPPGVKYCNISKIKCIDYYSSCETEKILSSCSCSFACSESVFKSTTTKRSMFHTSVISEYCKRNQEDNCIEYAKKRFAVANVYFQTRKVFSYEEESAYTIFNFWNDFSNVLGFLLGICVMTAPEVIVFIILACLCCPRFAK